MVSVGRHPNITLLTYSEVENVAGSVGDFKVQVRKKARYVIEDLCTGCGTCVEKCPWKKIPSEFDMGLGYRPAIHFHFAQAVPRIPVIDVENCAYFKSGKCGACEKFCPTGAIDFEQQDELLDLQAKMHKTIVFITHDLSVVAQIADRIMVLRYGNLVEENDAREMLAHPRETYTRDLLAVRSYKKGKRHAELEKDVILEIVGEKGTLRINLKQEELMTPEKTETREVK